jgi:hypothetical protein
MLTAAALFLCFFSTVFAYDWSTNPGDGSAANPYQISTAEQLNSIGVTTTIWTKCFILTNDIDMSAYTGTQYKIIGNATNKFAGTFEGNHFKITNLTYTTLSAVNYIGLFGYSSGATIQKLHLENVNISSGGRYVGGIIGCMGGGQVVNCSVTGTVVGYSYTGGLIGQASGEFDGCHTNCFVTSSGVTTFEGTGGIVGAQKSGTIIRCFSEGTVTGYAFVGGLVGEQEGIINQSYNKSTVNGIGTDTGGNPSWAIGGIAGFQMGGYIKDCYNTGNISGYSQVGGIIGRGIMQNCYSTGVITGQSETGGLSGYDIGTINSYWDIETSGIASSGGGKGRTSEQMKQALNYIGWNHDEPVWTLAEGEDYPHLAWEGMAGDYLPVHYLTEYVPGNGDEWEPYRISSAEQLNLVGLFPDTWDKRFILENDIDLSSIAGTEFNKIGTGFVPFSGIFDGQGYTISNFSYHSTGNEFCLGLFGYANGASIKNIKLRNADVASNGNGVGGLVGAMEPLETSFIENCSVTGRVSGISCVGGLVGAISGNVTRCSSDCSITGNAVVGGLIGRLAHGEIMNCYSLGAVIAVGDSGTIYVSDLDGQAAGGLVGQQIDGLICVSFSHAAVSGWSMLGGLVGAQSQGEWFWFNDATNAFISNCYSTGNVTGSDGSIYVGGLVGYQHIAIGTAAVINGYSAGHVTAGNNSNYIGGFIGYCGEAVFNSFWDVEASGLMEGAGDGSDVELAGKTTAEMKTRSTFTSAGWDFWGMPQNETDTIWAMKSDNNEGYPYLTSRQDFGTPENPYPISSAEELNLIGADTSLLDKCFVLVNDIDMSVYDGTQYNVIGNQFEPFTGTFDGQGHKISNLTYEVIDYVGYLGQVGLFGCTQEATIKNLGLENVYFMGDITVGGLAGNQYGGSIDHCYSTGVIGSYYGGGMVGSLCEGMITNSYSMSSVNSEWGGGLVGVQYGGIITGCFSLGSVTSMAGIESRVGGLVGRQEYGEINNCYSMASIEFNGTEFTAFAGGLAGEAMGSIVNCYSVGTITGSGDPNQAGGLVGNGGDVIHSFWDIQTSGLDHSCGGTGKTTVEMKALSTFTSAGWDFADTWTICEGTNYPRLQWQIPVWDFACPDGVGVVDLEFFVGRWLSDGCTSANNYCGGADLNSSGAVDLADYVVFAQHWLEM